MNSAHFILFVCGSGSQTPPTQPEPAQMAMEKVIIKGNDDDDTIKKCHEMKRR